MINQTILGFGWDEGPNLATARVDPLCGIMTNEGRRFMLVVGGSSNTNENLTDCEYIELPSNDRKKSWPWKKCNDLPVPFSKAQLIEDPETGDVLLLGGQEKIAIYRLSDVEGEWILQKETIMAARKYFSALVVPAGILNCDKSRSKINDHDEL